MKIKKKGACNILIKYILHKKINDNYINSYNFYICNKCNMDMEQSRKYGKK